VSFSFNKIKSIKNKRNNERRYKTVISRVAIRYYSAKVELCTSALSEAQASVQEKPDVRLKSRHRLL
jgi:hypothetical protein